ncbi:lysophospholipid acyltransferase family protein [Nesterenkonia sp. HG001]|uniref:lysophospholipid acyltransferase family protein n=1 Tax=Nesterenkonia sp. HG001 TaxID=2983207 RepID=UPI002AC4DF63|nr:lysophospholipid acyltransferase family protein [Nesterenkonia sp. HG001]MDZ5078066.1 1-acyl-sn-glycerol-3-phosphate acyltransferase [Nesterenkonia sp. HG001]
MTPPRHTPTSLSIRAAANAVRPALNLVLSKQWDGLDRLPRGGFIAVANHITEIDPLVVAHAVYSSGSTPHFLAKDSLFRIPVFGGMLGRLEQIPVARDQRGAQRSLHQAREALAAGGAIVIYPEGTLTRDPQLWPMRAKTGAARLALSTGVPVVPITHWGVQGLLAPYGKVPRILPRPRYRLRVGDPVDVADLRELPSTRKVLARATERIEDALTEGVAALRGEEPPELIWDRALRQRVPRRQVQEG